MPWTEKKSTFIMRFETKSIMILKNIDKYNFADVMLLSWKQAWNTIERAVTRGRERKKDHSHIIGIDEKSYNKGHKYITIVYDMNANGVEYIAYDRKKRSLDEYYETFSGEELSKI